MKKLLVLLLVLCMLFVLASCGKTAETDETTEEVKEDVDEKVAEVEEAEESKTLIFTCAMNENELIGQVIKNFCETVTEETNGQIQFECYWGGTMCKSSEELDIVGSGAADMCAIVKLTYAARLPLVQFPSGTCEGYEGTIGFASEIMFN
ncbi:MAG: hypothetical protein LUH07_02295, partial [Lachnospiraceae bacterium]|nr:hypothetical protein [Lachnospiraceae bacterium]